MFRPDDTDDIKGLQFFGQQFEIVDQAAREQLAGLEDFEPMDNFEIHDTINLIFG